MNPLQQLQEDAVNYLLGNPVTDAVPYTSLRRETIQSAFDQTQAAWKVRVPGKVGVTCMVLMPKAVSIDRNVPGPQLKLELTIRTFEDPKINNTTYSAEDVAAENLRWLDGLLIGGITQLYGDDEESALRPVYDYPGILVYDTVLKGACPQDYVGRTIDPILTDNGNGTASLSCTDPVAKIYFTVDGSMPQPGLASQLYAGAQIPIPMGTVLSYVAWNQAFLPSSVPRVVIEAPIN